VTDLARCTMCDKTMVNPKTLSCLHSFCLACLDNQLKNGGILLLVSVLAILVSDPFLPSIANRSTFPCEP